MRMKPLKDIKIRTKLVLLGTVCLLGLIVLGKESISTASRIKQAGDEVSGIWPCYHYGSKTDGKSGIGDGPASRRN